MLTATIGGKGMTTPLSSTKAKVGALKKLLCICAKEKAIKSLVPKEFLGAF